MNKRTTHYLLLILSFLTSNYICWGQQNLYFQNLSVNDGLSQNNVIAIAEDQEGFMWFATKAGLNKYDGNKITVFDGAGKKPGELSYSRINSLFVDDKDRIWVGTEGKGLNWYDKKTERFNLIAHDSTGKGFQGVHIRNIIAINEGQELLVLTELGLNKINVNSLAVTFIALNPLSVQELNNTYSLFQDRKKRVWIGVGGSGLLMLQPEGDFVKIDKPELFTRINGLVQDDDGNIWLTTENLGVYILNENTFELSRPPFRVGENIASTRLLCILKDKDSNIWIGTENGGIDIFYKSTGKLVNHRHDSEDSYSLTNNSIHSIYQDRSGRVWAGTFNQGVCFWDKYAVRFQTIRQKSTANSLSSNAVSSFALSDNPNLVWIGTDGGGLNLWNREKNVFEVFKSGKTAGFTSNAVLTVYNDNRGHIWGGTWGGGLICYNERTKQFSSYQELNTQIERPIHVFQFLADEKGNLWLATFDRGLCYYDLEKNEIKSYLQSGEDQMVSYLSTCLTINNNKEIWVGTIAGLHRFTPKEDGTYAIKVYSQSADLGQQLPNDYIQTVFIDKQNRLWVGTGGGGLCLYHPENDSFEVFNKNHELPSNEIFSIEQSEEGLLWVSSSKGLFRFDPEGKKIKTYDTKDGIQDLAFTKTASITLPNNKMLFGGVSGFNIFHPKEIKDNPFPPQLYFTDFKLFNKSVDIQAESSILKTPLEYTKTLELDHTQSVFTIEYVGVSMTHPDKNEYAYQLKGFDKEWNYVGNKTSATYTNLDGGTYTFLLKAANNDGLWTKKPKALTIIIYPPWWETTWFRAIAIITLIGGGVLFYKVRVRVLERQKVLLEHKVSVRTKELVEKQNEVATQNEELLQQSEEIMAQRDALQEQHQKLEDTLTIVQEKNRQITDSIRYAENIQQAILPSHERISQLFDNFFVIYQPKDIVSGDFYWATDRGGYIFMAVIDCTGHGVPGAFMSMIGNTLLNRIVKERKIYEPAEILKRLNAGVRKSLRQKTSKNTDGMDAAILRLKPINGGESYEVVFSGAKGNLYLFREENNYEHQIIKGSRKSIGAIYNEGVEYDRDELQLKKNDVFLLASDGIIDLEQEKGKRLGTNTFMEIASQNAHNLNDLEKVLTQTIEKSKASFTLRDDIAIVAVQL